MSKSLKFTILLTAALACFAVDRALAVEVLTNGSLDQSVGPLNWSSSEFISASSGGGSISLAEHISFGNSPNDATQPGLGMYLKPYVGNQGTYDMQNKKINYVLTQTASGVSLGEYSLTGDARISSGYSGAMAFLDPLSPSDPLNTGTVPSPTITKFEMAFLDLNSLPIGAPLSLDLRTDTTIFDDWQSHTLTGTTPAGTSKIKVTVSALDMVDNFGGQDVYFDNFKLIKTAQTINRLTNGNLNAAGAPLGWTLSELPAGTDNASFIGFAHHPTLAAPTGQGLWVRAYEGGDFLLQQTQPAVALGNYSFTGWSYFEQNYIGGLANATQTFLKLEFLDGANAILSTQTTDIRASRLLANPSNANDEMWYQHVLNALAPAGSVNVRITVGATGLGFNVDPKQSAFFDDFSLQRIVTGDYDGDGDVDGNDLLVVQRGLGSTYTGADITKVRNNFGAGGAVAAVSAAPEPATGLLAVVVLTALATRRRRVGA